jgi:hypothetical protein
VVEGGYRVVTGERLGRELVGTVGPRADLFVLYEKGRGDRALGILAISCILHGACLTR